MSDAAHRYFMRLDRRVERSSFETRESWRRSAGDRWDTIYTQIRALFAVVYSNWAKECMTYLQKDLHRHVQNLHKLADVPAWLGRLAFRVLRQPSVAGWIPARIHADFGLLHNAQASCGWWSRHERMPRRLHDCHFWRDDPVARHGASWRSFRPSLSHRDSSSYNGTVVVNVALLTYSRSLH